MSSQHNFALNGMELVSSRKKKKVENKNPGIQLKSINAIHFFETSTTLYILMFTLVNAYKIYLKITFVALCLSDIHDWIFVYFEIFFPSVNQEIQIIYI